MFYKSVKKDLYLIRNFENSGKVLATFVVEFYQIIAVQLFQPTLIRWLPPLCVHYKQTTVSVKVNSHDPILVQLSFKSFLCMMENFGVHTVQFSHPVIS